MVKKKEHDSRNADTPKKELYFEAEVRIRCRIAVAKEIRDRLRPGSARSELFRGTCFGPWLDVRSTSNSPNLVHLMLQTQYNPVMHQDALFFHVGGQELRFGPQEFCLITGLRFGPPHWGHGREDMKLRERVFGHVQGRVKVSDLKNVFDCSLDELSDLDAVRLCLLMLLEVGFMGCEPSKMVDLELLQLVDDVDSWNTFPWGSYTWEVVYEQLHNALAKRSDRHTFKPKTTQLYYTLLGFIWAFKLWIFEVFPYARRFAKKCDGIPRAISWDKNKRITWELALPFVRDTTPPGFEPLSVLTPTPAECATDWWRDSRQFFDGYANIDSSPMLKKARLSSPPQPSVMVHDQLIEDIADTTTTMPVDDIVGTTTMPVDDIVGTTTMSSFDNTTSDQSIECGETIEKTMLEKLHKPLVMTRLTSLEERVDELWKARGPRCVKTEMPTTLDLFDHVVGDHVVARKISPQSDIICVQGYKVKRHVAPILESIFNKHGDIAAECVFKPASMRSSFLEIVCEVVTRIQTNNDIDKIEEIEQQVLATEAANINVSWLRAHLETLQKRKEASKKCSLLMETKATTVSVKKAAILDLRERCVELVAAQERFEKAERCVRVLHLVEKNLSDSILESEGNIDSLTRQPVL